MLTPFPFLHQYIFIRLVIKLVVQLLLPRLLFVFTRFIIVTLMFLVIHATILRRSSTLVGCTQQDLLITKDAQVTVELL